jgi:molybdopterin molybdotransferase
MTQNAETFQVAEALDRVLKHTFSLPAETASLTSSALNRMLGEDVVSDIDSPPFTKSLMDGYAVRCADLAQGKKELVVVEEVLAGQVPTRTVEAGQAIRIMTGAPIPGGADAVVPFERTTAAGEDRVVIEMPAVKPGQFILARGSEMRENDVVLSRGTRLGPVEFGVLASAGRTSAQVIPAPRINILSTGDEVVEAPVKPGPGQIRNSNGPMLSMLAHQTGAVPRYLGNARDEVSSLRPLIEEGLHADILILCGGVSAGKRDLVPEELRHAGVTPHFHKVNLKPGKPLFFGTRSRGGSSRPDTLVFGLPGNPVSALVCFVLFVRPALFKMSGREPSQAEFEAALAEDYPYRTDRPTYHPARLEVASTGWQVRPVPWLGSPDLRALTGANALLVLPAGDHHHRRGERFRVISLEG